jgi:hypothetical protein
MLLLLFSFGNKKEVSIPLPPQKQAFGASKYDPAPDLTPPHSSVGFSKLQLTRKKIYS